MDEYRSDYEYLLKAPTLFLWWPIPIYLLSMGLFTYPFWVPSDVFTRLVALLLILAFGYYWYRVVERNFYLKRTVLNLQIEGSLLVVHTLSGRREFNVPLEIKDVAEDARKRLATTYGVDTRLIEIGEGEHRVFISSLTDRFDDIVRKLTVEVVPGL